MSFGAAIYLVFAAAPTEAVRGEHHRIAFIHGPATWVSVLIYVLTGAAAAFGLMTKQQLPSMLASALAPTGAMLAFVSLWTGALWGKPVWGVWWVWDAHLSSELLLLFLFLGFIALREAIDDNGRADRASGVLGLAGLVALPVLHFAVHWWNSRHGHAFPDVRIAPGSGISSFVAVLTMSGSLACYALAAAMTRLRVVILERERSAAWVSCERGS
ncbi:cytochrome c biogenesis protein CcsA [Aromatoleum sp.]|uniref:cytochrome c biogenesis protein CcsA n=1 Tax=Aromatoleum sp. TaxID=2307007 RepID=UPI002FC593F6